MHANRRVADILLTSVAPILWGTTYLTTTQLLPPGRPLLLGAMRAVPIGLLLMLYLRRLPSGIWWWRMLVLGMLNIGIVFGLLFEAAYRLPGGVAANIGAIQPLIVALLAWPVLKDKPSPLALVCALTAIFGVALLVLTPSAGFDPVGVACSVAMAFSMALGTIFTKRWGNPAPLLAFTAWQLMAGGLVLLPLALIFEGPPPAFSSTNIIGFTYLGIVTGLAYVVWFRGIERLQASGVTFLMLLVPLVASALGLVVLGQVLNLQQLIGGLIVMASIAASQMVSLRQTRQATGQTGAPAMEEAAR